MTITETKPATVKEISKSQSVRLIDIFLIGPFLIYTGTQSKISKTSSTLLIGIGAATIFYNGKNYLANKK